jgi:hypothetical protein
MIDAREMVGGVAARFNGQADDTAALVALLAKADEEFNGGHDVGGGAGDVVMLPKGAAIITAPIQAFSRLKGQGTHHTVLKFVGLPADQDAIVFGDGQRALFDAGLEDCQVFIEGPRAGNSAAVSTRDLQHTGGFKRVKIFAQGSIGLKISGGTGGASYIPIHDVEIFSKPELAGNPGMIIDYDGSSMVDLQRTVIQCPETPHVANSPACLISNGIVRAGVFHVENYDFGIQLQPFTASTPLLDLTGFTGNPNVHSVLVIAAQIPAGSVIARLGRPCGARNLVWNVGTGEELQALSNGEYRH